MSEYSTNTYQVKKDLTAELNQITMEFKAQQEELLALPEEEQALLAGEQARKKELSTMRAMRLLERLR
jgi:hypothetical protein